MINLIFNLLITLTKLTLIISIPVKTNVYETLRIYLLFHK